MAGVSRAGPASSAVEDVQALGMEAHFNVITGQPALLQRHARRTAPTSQVDGQKLRTLGEKRLAHLDGSFQPIQTRCSIEPKGSIKGRHADVFGPHSDGDFLAGREARYAVRYA